MFKEYLGVDLTKMYPPGALADDGLADKWTWDFFLTAAEKCFKAGQDRLMGVGFGVTNDSVSWVDPVFRSHGAAMVDQEGNITVKSDAIRQVLECSAPCRRSSPCGLRQIAIKKRRHLMLMTEDPTGVAPSESALVRPCRLARVVQ